MPSRKPEAVAALRRLGAALVKRRILSDRTQEDVAEAAGVSVQFLRRVERGTGNPSYLTLRSIARALGAAVSDLAREEEKHH